MKMTSCQPLRTPNGAFWIAIVSLLHGEPSFAQGQCALREDPHWVHVLRVVRGLDAIVSSPKPAQRVQLFPSVAAHLAAACRAGRDALCAGRLRAFLTLWRATAGLVTDPHDAVVLIDAYEVLLRQNLLLDPTPPRRLASLFLLPHHQ